MGAVSGLEIVVAALIFTVVLAIAVVVNRLLGGRLKKDAKKAPPVSALIYSAVRLPATMLWLAAGLYLALLTLPWSSDGLFYLNRAAIIATGGLGLYTLSALIWALLNWYETRQVRRPNVGVGARLIPLARTLVLLVALFSLVVIVLLALGKENNAHHRLDRRATAGTSP
jgi:preprotein translocase subunit SecG